MATIYYTATSLDGFIATKDDDVSWLDLLPQPEEDTYTPFIEKVGAIAMGRSTYEFIVRHVLAENPWPYDQPCWVFTHHPDDLEIPDGADVRFVNEHVMKVHADMMAESPRNDIWIAGGGDLAGQFLDAELLDELVITVASRTLGEGKPLLPRDESFRLRSARSLGKGFAELRYEPVRASPSIG